MIIDFKKSEMQNMSLNKITGLATGMIVLLALSTFDTAFLVVNLAKDTRIDSDGFMVSNNGSSTVIKTQPVSSVIMSTRNYRSTDRRLGEYRVLCLTKGDFLSAVKACSNGLPLNISLPTNDGTTFNPATG